MNKAYPFKCRTKFNASKVSDIICFQSKLEYRFYKILLEQKKLGVINFFLLQTPIHLAPKLRYIADFTVFYANHTAEFLDVKGRDTPISIAKRKCAQQIIKQQITLVTTDEVTALERELHITSS
jgi:hypothetical protein